MSTATRNVASLTISELETESTRLGSLLGQQESNIADTRAQLATVRAELDKRRRGAVEPRLSDHAIIRFLERSMGIDIDQVRARILNDKVRAAIKSGASAVTVDGTRLKVSDNVIVTVLDTPAKHFKPLPRSKAEPEPSIKDGLADYFDEYAKEVV